MATMAAPLAAAYVQRPSSPSVEAARVLGVTSIQVPRELAKNPQAELQGPTCNHVQKPITQLNDIVAQLAK